jgi:hypothetical protein
MRRDVEHAASYCDTMRDIIKPGNGSASEILLDRAEAYLAMASADINTCRDQLEIMLIIARARHYTDAAQLVDGW